jgi:hypothetical protein
VNGLSFSALVQLLSALVLLATVYYNVKGWPAMTEEDRSKWRDAGIELLERRITAEELAAALERYLPIRLEELMSLPLVGRVVALDTLSDESLDALRKICERCINPVNRFSELVDARLVRPGDLVQRRWGIHVDLLRELTLVESFVWYDSLVKGRGRWGMRPLQLRKTLLRLRSRSPREQPMRSITVRDAGGGDVVLLPALSWWRRFLGKVPSPRLSYGISRRTKVGQRRERARMRKGLERTGILAPQGHTPW